MNYFTHGLPHLSNPWFLAGTALPDWLGAFARRTRPRPENLNSDQLQLLAPDPDRQEQVQQLLAGLHQHHHDDQWFHRTAAFQEVVAILTRDFRNQLGAHDGFRSGFLAHIMTELLLDACLMDRYPGAIDRYYQQMQLVDPELIENVVNLMSTHSTTAINWLIPAFLEERFLPDYLDDALLANRIRQVWKRIGLDPLPDHLVEVIPQARKEAAARTDELLPSDLYSWPM